MSQADHVVCEIVVTQRQGQNILSGAESVLFPEKIGGEEVSHKKRATWNRNIRFLMRSLRDVSPVMLEDDVSIFGPRGNYEFKKDLEFSDSDRKVSVIRGIDLESAKYVVRDRKLKTKVSLSKRAHDGLFRLFFLWVHPASPFCQSPRVQDDTVWPIAEQAGFDIHLAEKTGSTSGETEEIKINQEYADSKDAKKVESLELK